MVLGVAEGYGFNSLQKLQAQNVLNHIFRVASFRGAVEGGS